MTMRHHLEDDALLDVIEGAASVEATRHAGECAACARRMADARVGLAMAAGAEAPEPSPLFWDAFRGRVASAIETEPRPRRFGGFFVPALLATAAMVAVVTLLPTEPGAPALSPAPLAASSAVPAADDAALEGFPGTASADDMAGCHDVAACVADLSDEESRAFAEALRAELGKNGDL
jgi:hypothetical protein